MAAPHGWPQAPPRRLPGAGAPHPSRPPIWFRLVLALLLAGCLAGAWQRPPIRVAGLGSRQGEPVSWDPATRLASGVLVGTAIVWVLFFWSE